jgi:hypothetical protein
MSLDLLTEDHYRQQRSILQTPQPVEAPSAFEGFTTAIPLGIKRTWDIGAEALADVASPVVEDAAQYWLGDNAREWMAEQTAKTREIVKKGQRTPQEMGVVSNILYQASSVISAAMVGGAIGGTPGAMAAAGAVSGRERYLELKEQGVDDETARSASYVAGGTMAVGVGLAPYYGIRALTQVASGVGINVGLGAADRYGTHKIVADAGYMKAAEHYKTLDGTSIAADAILGAAFPFAARAWKNIKTSDIDAALSAQGARQADTSMPNLPRDPNDIQVQAEAIDGIKEQMFAEGKSVYDIVTPNMADGVPNAKLAGESIIAVKNFEDIVRADPELSAFKNLRPEDFDVAMKQDINEGETAAQQYDAFTSQQAAKIAQERPDAMVSVDGENVRVADVETRLQAEVERANQDSALIRVATACAISRG